MIDRCYCRSLVVDFRLLIAPTSSVSKRSGRNFENDHFLSLDLLSNSSRRCCCVLEDVTPLYHYHHG
jgi:hypothetical protein